MFTLLFYGVGGGQFLSNNGNLPINLFCWKCFAKGNFTQKCSSGHTFWIYKYIGLTQKKPKIDTLDALEEHKERDDDYQTVTN